MNALKKKLNKNGGFTLVEMLIVVAIIAILIAISIPLISSSLEKSRHAVDDANIRDAQSLATVYYLTKDNLTFDATTNELELTYYVNAQNQGRVFADADATEIAEFKGEPVKPECTYSGAEGCYNSDKDVELTVTITSTGDIKETSWGKFHSADAAASPSASGTGD